MPNRDSHRHHRIKHIALRTLGVGAVAGWRVAGRLARTPAMRTRVAIICDGQLLLIQNITNFRKWTLPGGGYHKDEGSVECAIRELREELHVTIPKKAFQYTGQFTEDQRGTIYTYDVFIATISKRPHIRISWELAHARWVPLDDLPENISPYINDVLSKRVLS